MKTFARFYLPNVPDIGDACRFLPPHGLSGAPNPNSLSLSIRDWRFFVDTALIRRIENSPWLELTFSVAGYIIEVSVPLSFTRSRCHPRPQPSNQQQSPFISHNAIIVSLCNLTKCAWCFACNLFFVYPVPDSFDVLCRQPTVRPVIDLLPISITSHRSETESLQCRWCRRSVLVCGCCNWPIRRRREGLKEASLRKHGQHDPQQLLVRARVNSG